MKYRKLRIAWSVVCGVMWVVITVCWWRSYSYFDNYVYRCETVGLATSSYAGSLYPGILTSWRSLPWEASDGRLRINHWPVGKQTDWMASMRDQHTVALGFGVINSSAESVLIVPYWILNIATALCAVLVWPKELRRFRIRTLLFATTLIAIVFGIAIWAAK